MKAGPEVVIVSGGAETVSIALADALNQLGRPYSVLCLNPASLLEGLAGCRRSRSLWQPSATFDDTRMRLIDELRRLHAELGHRFVVFATEDDGLSLLNASIADLSPICVFSRGRALRSGGLNKNELFERLRQAGLSDLIPVTHRLSRVDEVPTVLGQLEGPAIIKPAHKPWQRTIDTIGSKVFDSEHYLQHPDGQNRLLAQLKEHWALSSSWLVQEKLTPFHDGEHSTCVVRSQRFSGIQVVEQLQYPAHGGSAVIVKSTQDRSLMAISKQIATAIDLDGMAEMSFLLDHDHQPRLIELNTRPWLQIALVEASGFAIVEETLLALERQAMDRPLGQTRDLQWIHPEQLLRGWLTGGFGPRWHALRRIVGSINSWPVFAVYSARLKGIRWRWIKRNLGKLFNSSRSA